MKYQEKINAIEEKIDALKSTDSNLTELLNEAEAALKMIQECKQSLVDAETRVEELIKKYE